MAVKSKELAVFLLLALAMLQISCPVSAASPAARVFTGVVFNAVSSLAKRLWTFKYTSKPAVSSHRAMMKFESGYNVETVFDGSKLGIEPYSVEVTQSGELLVLDSANSNLYHIALPLSRYSRPKLVAGSPDGDAGHVDGRLREARMNHPQSFTVDDKGNIYVADTMNMAIRKISDTGITTIAGGKYNRGGHVDGPSEDAKFSTDFEVVYISSSCSLLVVDRGNQAIREIQLHFDDCAYQYEAGFPLGIAVLFAAVFFGYMLALLQRRVGAMVSAKDEPQTPQNHNMPPYQKPMKSVRPPLIAAVDDLARAEEEGLFGSLGKLLTGAWSSTTEILGAMLMFRRKPQNNLFQQQQRRANTWPGQDSFVIPQDEIPPPFEARTPTTHKTYAFMSKEPEKIHHVRHSHAYFAGWDGEHPQHLQQQQQQKIMQQQQKIHPQQHPPQQQKMHHHQHLQQHRQYSSGPQTFYEQSCETTKETVFGAVQELDNTRRNVEIRSVNYGDPFYEQHGLRFRNTYLGYDNMY